MNTLLSATTLAAVLRSAVKDAQGNVDVDATCDLVRRSLIEGPKSKAVNVEELTAVATAVSAAFDAAGPGKPIQRKELAAAASLASPEHGERILTDLLASGDYVGRQRVGFYRAGEAPAVKPKPAPKPLTVIGAATAQAQAPSASEASEELEDLEIDTDETGSDEA